MKQKSLNKARWIRDIMTTPMAGAYRLNRLPKSATLETITKIYNAVVNEYSWQPVYESQLYKKDGSAYCHILAVIHYYFRES